MNALTAQKTAGSVKLAPDMLPLLLLLLKLSWLLLSLLSIWWRTRRRRVAGEVLPSLDGGVKGVIVLMVILRSDRIVSRQRRISKGSETERASFAGLPRTKSLLLSRSK